NVGGFFAEEFIAGLGVALDRRLVRHSAGGHIERRLLAEIGGHLVLQLVNGRVFVEHIVTDLGRRHEGPHGWRGPGYRVAAKVDRGVGHYFFRSTSTSLFMYQRPSIWRNVTCRDGTSLRVILAVAPVSSTAPSFKNLRNSSARLGSSLKCSVTSRTKSSNR